MSRKVAGFGILILVGGIFPAGVQANVITLNPQADAFVNSANPSSNYGAAGALAVAAVGLSNGEFQSVLKFDTSSAKSSFDAAFGAGKWTIQSITLQLTSAAPGNPIFNSPSAAGSFSVSWMQNNSWVGGTGTPKPPPSTTGITYNTLPSYLNAGDQALGTFYYNRVTSGATSYTLGLASGLTGNIYAGSLAGMRLFAADSSINYICNSVNNGTFGSQPVLTIDAVMVPEPASLALLALGGTLVLQRKGKKA